MNQEYECKVAQSTVPLPEQQFLMEVFERKHGPHPRACYGGSLFTFFPLSSLFVLFVFFYVFNFLVSFTTHFSGGWGSRPCEARHYRPIELDEEAIN